MSDNRDARYMALALAQARKAAAAGEVPVGAVLVRPGRGGAPDEVLAQAYNQPIASHDPTAHAEIVALRAAAAAVGNYRLDGCELYVTLEPCAMCAQALLHARIARVVYGAREPKTGADGSVVNVLRHPALNHHTAVEGGTEAEACAALMQTFFAEQRARARREAVPLRDDALRTPEGAFELVWAAVPDWRQAQRWTQCGTVLDGLRLHWLDLAPPATTPGAPVTVALHGPNGWWPEWLDWAKAQVTDGQRLLLPDLIGFGLSDKPKKARWHTLARHADVLAEWLQEHTTAPLRLVAPPTMEALAQAIAQRLPGRPVGVLVQQPPEPTGLPAHWRELPYPDAGHRAARKAWPWPERG